MNLCGIYQIINTTNNKKYIGSSKHLLRRWNTHKYQLSNQKHSNSKLQRAWNKHGEEAFEFSILEECEIEHLILKEQHYLDTIKPEYNILKTAYSALGHTLSDESKQKIREKSLGRTFSKETLQKMREAKLGKPSVRRGKKLSPEHKEQLSIKMTGKKFPFRRMGNNNKLTKEDLHQIHTIGVNYQTDNKIKHTLAKQFNVSEKHIIRVLTGKRHRESYYLFHGEYPK